MSKDIIIQKDGVSQQLQGVEKIRTSLVGGGTEDWVPEDEYTGGVLSVQQNGTYTASERGLYAFTRVIAAVQVGSVRGYIDGVLYDISVDENGNLVYTLVE